MWVNVGRGRQAVEGARPSDAESVAIARASVLAAHSLQTPRWRASLSSRSTTSTAPRPVAGWPNVGGKLILVGRRFFGSAAALPRHRDGGSPITLWEIRLSPFSCNSRGITAVFPPHADLMWRDRGVSFVAMLKSNGLERGSPWRELCRLRRGIRTSGRTSRKSSVSCKSSAARTTRSSFTSAPLGRLSDSLVRRAVSRCNSTRRRHSRSSNSSWRCLVRTCSHVVCEGCWGVERSRRDAVRPSRYAHGMKQISGTRQQC